MCEQMNRLNARAHIDSSLSLFLFSLSSLSLSLSGHYLDVCVFFLVSLVNFKSALLNERPSFQRLIFQLFTFFPSKILFAVQSLIRIDA